MQHQEKTIYDDCVALVVKLLDELSEEPAKERRAELLDLARRKAVECVERTPNSAESNYLAGQISYDSFCDEEKYGAAAESFLTRAIALDPNHQFARMFLGHYYYDTARYGEALECFRKIDENYFTAIPQRWRVLKLRELILCCRIFLGSSDVTEQDFEKLAVEYVSADPWDVLPPWELISALQKSVGSPIWTFLDAAHIKRIVFDMVMKLDVSDGFREDASRAFSQIG